MQAVVLFLNDKPDDPTKRLKLAGVRRYAAAAGWKVVVSDTAHSRTADIPPLLAAVHPAGCIFDCDGDPSDVRPRHFGRTPVVFAGGAPRGFGPKACPVGVDNAAVADAAFRELSAGAPKACAVAACMEPAPWASERIAAFAALAKAAGLPCFVFRRKRGESMDFRDTRFSTWFARLPPHTAIFGVNDLSARIVARAAVRRGFRFPHDFTLVGVDNDLALCEAEAPTFTSIQLDFERMGYLAAKALGRMMGGRTGEPGGTCGTGDNCPTGRARRACPASPPSAATAIGPLLAVRRESTLGRGRREPHVLEAVEIIRREACDGLSVAALARRIPGSRALLDLRFREAMGHSAMDEILHVRLERVFDLLRRLEMPISAIADFSGFGSLRALDKLFRARFGCSLRAWRKRNAGP